MKLCIVTAVFNLRKTRPLEYYTIPAVDFLNDFLNSEIEICLFTNLDKNIFPQAQNIHIIQKSPDSFISEMWDNENWRAEYTTALEARLKIQSQKIEQNTNPELLSVWLGKFPMMKFASQYGDMVLWHDSGVRTTMLWNQDFTKYKKCKLYPEKYLSFIQSLNYPLVFMKNDGYDNQFHGVSMSKYETPGKHYQVRAGFILAKSSETTLLQKRIKEKWWILTHHKEYGTEENALTMYQWQRPDSGLLSCDEWLDGLGLKNLS